MRIGYTRVSTAEQDLTAQRDARVAMGIAEANIYMDQGLTGTNRARPELGKALAAVRAGDELVVTKLDRLARSIRDAQDIAQELADRGVALRIGQSVYDPSDAFGKMWFNMMALFAEFEADLIRQRTREGMAVAKAKGRLKGKAPKLSPVQEKHLVQLHGQGEHTVAKLAEIFKVGGSTVYRALERAAKSGASTRP